MWRIKIGLGSLRLMFTFFSGSSSGFSIFCFKSPQFSLGLTLEQ